MVKSSIDWVDGGRAQTNTSVSSQTQKGQPLTLTRIFSLLKCEEKGTCILVGLCLVMWWNFCHVGKGGLRVNKEKHCGR